MLKKLKFISFKSPWSHFENKKSQFSKNSLWSNHRIPYFVDKACFAKPWNSLFFGEVLFAENTKFLIFWTPYFRRSTVGYFWWCHYWNRVPLVLCFNKSLVSNLYSSPRKLIYLGHLWNSWYHPKMPKIDELRKRRFQKFGWAELLGGYS